jgi:predicted metal-dependent hydrolase
MGGDPVTTHVANGANLLFPAGERAFVRSVRRYWDRLDEPTRRRVRGFFEQEGRHANAHEQLNLAMEQNGLTLRPWLAWYERKVQRIEQLTPPVLRLSATVALEHYTAIMAESALGGDLLDGADPAVRRLLSWHACEEIEHKAVAFDVLRQINPSYAVRIAGLAVATLTLGGFWILATRMLLRQEGIGGAELWRRLGRLHRRRPIGRRVFLRGIREYLRRDFHPWDRDDAELARAWLAREGLS